jgi:hypothetical protein
MARNAEIGPVTRRPKTHRWNLGQSNAGGDATDLRSDKQLIQRLKADVTMYPLLRQVRRWCALSQVPRHA